MYFKGIVCTDLDGTILFREDDKDYTPYIKERDLAALNALSESGYMIAITTGREMNGIRSFLRQAGVAFDYYVGGNGGIILNQHFKVLRKAYLPKDVMVRVVKFINTNYPEIQMMGTDGWKVFFFETAYANAQVQESRAEAETITFEAYEYSDKGFIMMNANAPRDFTLEKQTALADSLERDLNIQFGREINIFRNQNFLDFAPINISKGNAVEYLADHLNLDMSKVHVIGDSWNDLSMFETKANSYSFLHADDDLQKRADEVVESFADMVAKLGLIEEK
jgi:HAD-superfamily hydrolase, subfamily IIB